MRYRALACDYDGTIAHNSRVDDATVAALEKARESGRPLILVTGRTLPDLRDVFSRLDLFDILVVENGAALCKPDEPEEMVLGEPPASMFVDELRKRRIEPLSQGRVIVATWEPHETLESGLLRCRAGAVTFETGGRVYAVNGRAMSDTQNLDIGRILAPGFDTPKKSIGPLLAAGLALCD